MDPITIAGSFATIVGLIGQFRGERNSQERLELNEFLGWLIENQRADMKDLIQSHEGMSGGIKLLLAEHHDSLQSKLDGIESALANYASKLPGFSDLVGAMRPDSILSPQAWSILKQFSKSQASKVLELKTFDGTSLMYLDSPTENEMQIAEPRFLEDDLANLVEIQLLRHSLNSKGDNLYTYTRAANRLIEADDS